jgi:hypothetical protein
MEQPKLSFYWKFEKMLKKKCLAIKLKKSPSSIRHFERGTIEAISTLERLLPAFAFAKHSQ